MATIFCFTSTGNSLYTAKMIAEKVSAKVVPMNQASLSCDDDVIGFVFPVYFWGPPRMVERFIADLQIKNKNAYIFAVDTYGGIVHGVLGIINKLLKSKGVFLNYGVSLKSVENYIPAYKVNDSEAFRQRIDEAITKITDAIIRKDSNRIQSATILNKLIYSFYPNERSDEYFTVSSACTGCATCQKVCPVNNITMETGEPGFRHRCEHCLACVHICPVQAINWKQKTQGKERYINVRISLNDLISFNSKVNN